MVTPRILLKTIPLAHVAYALLDHVLGWANISRHAPEIQTRLLPISATLFALSVHNLFAVPVASHRTCVPNIKATPLTKIMRELWRPVSARKA